MGTYCRVPGHLALARAGVGAALVAGLLLGASATASAAGDTLYAYATGTGNPSGCPAETAPTDGCSLAQALAQADPSAGGAIVILETDGADGHYLGTFTLDPSGTSAGSPVTIAAATGTSPVLDGQGAGTVLTITGGYVAITGVTIENGRAPGGTPANNGTPATAGGNGGGINNAATLALTGDTITQDTAGPGGDGLLDYSEPGAPGGAGGGVYSTGPLTLTGTTIDGDSAGPGGTGNHGGSGGFAGPGGSGGGIFATAPVTLTGGDTISGDQAGPGGSSGPQRGGAGGAGGGIASLAAVTVTGSTLDSDSAGPGGYGVGGGGGDGGAVWAGGGLVLTGSTVSNSAAGPGGANPGSGDIGGGGSGGGAWVQGPMTVTASTFTSDQAGAAGSGQAGWTAGGGSGGAIWASTSSTLGSDTIASSTFSGDTAGAGSGGRVLVGGGGGGGGGVEFAGSGVLDVSASTFTDDRAGDGGVPRGETGGPGGNGGAIDSSGTLVVTASTFSGDRAGAGISSYFGGNGGDGGAISNTSSLSVANATFSADQAGAAGDASGTNGPGRAGDGGSGGAVWSTGTASVAQSTFSADSAGAGGVDTGDAGKDGLPGTGGDIDTAGTDVVSVAGSILTGTDPVCAGPLTDGGFNVADASSCPGTQAPDSAIGLGALADNGGPVATQAIGSASAAYHVVPQVACQQSDARGVPRPQPVGSDSCDAGAFEYAPPVVLGPGAAQAGQPVTLIGSGFTLVTGVTVGGAPSAFSVTSDTALGLTAPETPGDVQVQVSNPDGTVTFELPVYAASHTVAELTPNTAVYSESSQPVPVSATVSSSAGTVDGGQLTFTLVLGPSAAVTQTVDVGQGAAATTLTLPAGTPAGDYVLSADYSDPGGFLQQSSGGDVLHVTPAATSTLASGASVPSSSAAQPVTLSATVTSPAGPVGEGSVTFTVSLAGRTVGTATSAQVAGGSATVQYQLPAGLAPGTYSIGAIYQPSDGNLQTSSDDTQTLIVIGPPVVATTGLAAATLATPYHAQLAATGGAGGYSWSVTSGQLPIGLSLDPASGVVSGTPLVPGTSDFTVTVTDGESPARSASRPLSITVGGCMTTVSGRHGGRLVLGAGVDCLTGALVDGPVQVAPGAVLAITGSTLHGPVRIVGAAQVVICGSTLDGPLDVVGATGTVMIGDAGTGSPPCSADTVHGPVNLADDSGGVSLAGDVINGPVHVTGNVTSATGLPAAPVVSADTIAGPLSCTANLPAPVDPSGPSQVRGPATGQCAALAVRPHPAPPPRRPHH